jgi:hypothetical protein
VVRFRNVDAVDALKIRPDRLDDSFPDALDKRVMAAA